MATHRDDQPDGEGLPLEPSAAGDPNTEHPFEPGAASDPNTGLPFEPGAASDPNTGLPFEPGAASDPNTGLPFEPGAASDPNTGSGENKPIAEHLGSAPAGESMAGSGDSNLIRDFFEPAEPDDPDTGGGEPVAAFMPGRPVTIITPKVPRARSSIPYSTLALVVLALVATAVIVVFLGQVGGPADDPTQDEPTAITSAKHVTAGSESAPSAPGNTNTKAREAAAGTSEIRSAQVATPQKGADTDETSASATETQSVKLATPQEGARAHEFNASASQAKTPERAGADSKRESIRPPKRNAAQRARMQYKRGNAYMRDKRLNAAIASYERALELDPSFTKPLGPLYVAYTRAGKRAKAKAAFDAYVRDEPEKERAQAKRELMREFSGE